MEVRRRDRRGGLSQLCGVKQLLGELACRCGGLRPSLFDINVRQISISSIPSSYLSWIWEEQEILAVSGSMRKRLLVRLQEASQIIWGA